MNVMRDHLFTEDTLHHKNIMRTIEKPICTSDDLEFTREEIEHTIESFNHKEVPGINGNKCGIYLRTFNTLPRLVTVI